MPNKSFDRGTRLNHIHMSFVNRWKNGKRQEVTSSQVARALMLEPSGHIRGLLSELVLLGKIQCRLVDDERAKNLKGGHSKIAYYQLSESEQNRLKREEREIDIKKNGVVVGQLRLI